MVGGVLEYSSMLFGIPSLNLLALAIYALALAACLRRRPSAPEEPPPLPAAA